MRVDRTSQYATVAQLYSGGASHSTIAAEISAGRSTVASIIGTLRNNPEFADLVSRRREYRNRGSQWAPPVVDERKGHCGAWSRTISKWHLRIKIYEHTAHGGQTALARMVGTNPTTISRALSTELNESEDTYQCDDVFDRLALLFGYRRQHGNREFFVALERDEDPSSIALPEIKRRENRRAA